MRKNDKNYCTKISVCNLGMSVGLVWGLAMFIIAFLSVWFGMGIPFVEIFSTIYIGYNFSVIGALLGFFWGFIDGFIFGALIAFFYNWFSYNCPCLFCKKTRRSKK